MSTTENHTVSTDRWEGLRPRNVVQAAKADMERLKRNERRASSAVMTDDYEEYAFMRHHVKRADGAFGLIQLALDVVLQDGQRPPYDRPLRAKLLKSTKTHMKHLYSAPLLRAALEMERDDG